MMRRDRSGLTAAELLLTLSLQTLIVGAVIAFFTGGSRQSQDLIALDGGLNALNVARAVIGRDLNGATTASASATGLRILLPRAMLEDGTVRLERVTYGTTGGSKAFLTRNGRRIAGPFTRLEFNASEDLAGEHQVKLVLGVEGGSRGAQTAISIQAHLHEHVQLAGLRELRGIE